MSTTIANPQDLIPFSGSAGLPAYLQQGEFHSSLEDQYIGTSVDRITQRDGGVVVERGGVKSDPMLSIDVVILDASPKGFDTYRAYYANTFSEDGISAPTCYSADGKVPSPNAAEPQCTSCQLCPKNAQGSGPAGGESKACGFFKHVAVATYPDLDTVYRLKVSSRSLFNKEDQGIPSPLGGKAWGLNSFAKRLKEMKVPWESVVTRVSLPRGQTHGFFFTPVGFLHAQQFQQIQDLKKSSALEEALTVEVAGGGNATAIPALPQLPQLPPVAPTLAGRAKWLSSQTLPQQIKDWIAQVDDNTALTYLTQNYPTEV